jgi:hypothetical protein
VNCLCLLKYGTLKLIGQLDEELLSNQCPVMCCTRIWGAQNTLCMFDTSHATGALLHVADLMSPTALGYPAVLWMPLPMPASCILPLASRGMEQQCTNAKAFIVVFVQMCRACHTDLSYAALGDVFWGCGRDSIVRSKKHKLLFQMLKPTSESALLVESRATCPWSFSNGL